MSISLEIIRKPLIRNATHKIRSGWNCSSYNELYHSWVVVVVVGGGGLELSVKDTISHQQWGAR